MNMHKGSKCCTK